MAASPSFLGCPQAQGFKLTPRQLEAAITSRTRWLILNTPGNSTGLAYSAQELSALAEVLNRHPRIGVLADEIYNEIWYERDALRSLVAIAPELADRILLVNGASKTYAMTGWRIGYAAGPKGLVDAINVLQSHSSSCPSAISQAAAISGHQDRGGRVVELSCGDPAEALVLRVGCNFLGEPERISLETVAEAAPLFGEPMQRKDGITHDVAAAASAYLLTVTLQANLDAVQAQSPIGNGAADDVSARGAAVRENGGERW